MQSYIETLGRMISAQVAPHPRRARRMLTAAYSWVRFSGKCQKLTDAKSAYARMNGAVARSLVRGLRHPERASRRASAPITRRCSAWRKPACCPSR